MSTVASELSQASTKINDDAPAPIGEKVSRTPPLYGIAESASAQDILFFLIAFRILNALSVKTFFQPDEFFQSLEPAWQMVFGKDSGAWITWEWKHHLRSAVHPAIFAGVYYVANLVANALRLSPLSRADLLITVPRITQAGFAAAGDFYTWKLAELVYGRGSPEAWGALALTVVSPWQWFCSTRTLSNCLEATLTAAAFCLWPWHWSMNPNEDDMVDEDGLRTTNVSGEEKVGDELSRLRRCLLLAAFACILRPTNLLIWLCLVFCTMLQHTTGGWLVPAQWVSPPIMIQFSSLAPLRATKRERIVLFREAVLCGSVILALAALIDRLYYQTWTFPPLRFLYFNIAQSLAVFYGKNDWHYYLSQGYPLLLTTALPFALIGLYNAIFPARDPETNDTPPQATLTKIVKSQLAAISILVPTVLSLISHKEVRFLSPLLPPLHILASPPLTSFFSPFLFPSKNPPNPRPSKAKPVLLFFLLAVNVAISSYTSFIHQSGPLSLLSYLRHEHAVHYSPFSQPPDFSPFAPTPPHSSHLSEPTSNVMTVGMLMPCHSTPWRSHLVFPSIHAWALSCEPPVNLNSTARSSYLDEADRFYEDPALFLKRTMPRPPRKASSFQQMQMQMQIQMHNRRHPSSLGDAEAGGKRQWPSYLIFFQHLESTMAMLLRGSGYGECHRIFNSHVHDDWRRRGDIIVYCLRAQQVAWEKQEVARERAARRSGAWNGGRLWDRVGNMATNALWAPVRLGKSLAKSLGDLFFSLEVGGSAVQWDTGREKAGWTKRKENLWS